MPKERSRLSTMLSTLYAMLLLCALASLVENKLSIWNQLGTHEKFWIIFAAAYAVILTASGFLSAVIKWRTAGFIHAVLMLGIAGLVLFGIANDWVTSPGADNAAAGIVAIADFVFIAGGVLAAICGVTVMRCVFPEKEKPETPTGK
ncbi:MAG: hypothetical protein ACLPYZ_13320 [Limisphaerales bacterium]